MDLGFISHGLGFRVSVNIVSGCTCQWMPFYDPANFGTQENVHTSFLNYLTRFCLWVGFRAYIGFWVSGFAVRV